MTGRPARGEFRLIAELFAPLAAHGGAHRLTDDCAYLEPGPGQELVIKTDAVVSGIDFLPDTTPEQVAAKALRVNLSDLAAKGAEPIGYVQTLGLPRDGSIDDRWLERYAGGLGAEQQRYGLALLGGDITATDGAFWISLTVFGRIPRGSAPLRSAARPGDRVFVTGSIGDAVLGLAVLQGRYQPAEPADRDFLVDRYLLPQPRLAEGRAWRGLVHAAADVSDGLIADLGHIATASGVSIEIEAARVPLSTAARRAIATDRRWLARLLTGGDDYELICTAAGSVPQAAEIGVVAAGTGVMARDPAGQAMQFDRTGYAHL